MSEANETAAEHIDGHCVASEEVEHIDGHCGEHCGKHYSKCGVSKQATTEYFIKDKSRRDGLYPQ